MSRKRIASKLHLLSVREVQNAADGDHADGGGLLLRVGESSAAWLLRFTSPGGKRRETGLGTCHRNNAAVVGKSLANAREAACSEFLDGKAPASNVIDLKARAAVASGSLTIRIVTRYTAAS